MSVFSPFSCLLRRYSSYRFSSRRRSSVLRQVLNVITCLCYRRFQSMFMFVMLSCLLMSCIRPFVFSSRHLHDVKMFLFSVLTHFYFFLFFTPHLFYSEKPFRSAAMIFLMSLSPRRLILTLQFPIWSIFYHLILRTFLIM